MNDLIEIRGARLHNLKNVDLDIPKNRLVVVTGVSGSGKSTLALQTLHMESMRQLFESLGEVTFGVRLPPGLTGFTRMNEARIYVGLVPHADRLFSSIPLLSEDPPVLSAAPLVITCKILHRYPAGDHDIIVGAVEEAAAAGAKLRSLLPRQMRRGLVDDGRWLNPDARDQLREWVEQRPRIRTLVEYRARLRAVLEARSHDASERLRQLQAWCQEAEASGIRVLEEYSARLKGYSLQAART